MDPFDASATDLLRRLTGQPAAEFRDGQLDAIRALVVDRRRTLVVQRTGWGKSAVYFIATRLLRDAGAGPTLLISPLLALMRNQIAAAQRMGVRAETINSDNQGAWAEVTERVQRGEVDLLLVSPERLANRRFRDEVLDHVGSRAGLVVVDEAHCISDWGHDFRPDYRRIKRVLDLLPAGVPVMACTATANDRVVDDVAAQLGTDLAVFRGPLARAGLALQVIGLEAPAARLAWLAEVLPTMPGSGIVYCLTVRDTQVVTEWLTRHGMRALAYSGESADRPAVEQALLDNSVDVVVATSALGMGFDKPDLAFVVHYQAPGSVVHYYQQVGRAGRQLTRSHGALLCGREDAQIQDWFIEQAFPSADDAARVIEALDRCDGYVRAAQLEGAVNIGRTRLTNILKNLEVDRYVVADGQKYQRTAVPYAYDRDRVEAVTAIRRAEQAQMTEYAGLAEGCRMAFLAAALDDPHAEPCGACDLCGGDMLPTAVDPGLAARAAEFLRAQPLAIEPRKQWPDGKRIPADEQVSEGRALCRWNDGGWGDLVRLGRRSGRFDDELVTALAKLSAEWGPVPSPTWVTWVPSGRHTDLVADLAQRVADALGLPVVGAVAKRRPTKPQHTLQNSAQQLANVVGAYEVRPSPALPAGPAILVDHAVDSRWTLTFVGSLLRLAGAESVVPLVLADTRSS